MARGILHQGGPMPYLVYDKTCDKNGGVQMKRVGAFGTKEEAQQALEEYRVEQTAYNYYSMSTMELSFWVREHRLEINGLCDARTAKKSRGDIAGMIVSNLDAAARMRSARSGDSRTLCKLKMFLYETFDTAMYQKLMRDFGRYNREKEVLK